MYTATIKNKVMEFGILTVWVEFTDGTNTVVEWCKPQDEDGLKYWVKSRIAQLNSSQIIDEKLTLNDPVDVSEPVVTPYVPTAEEVARIEWLKHYQKWVKVRTTLIDTGVLTGNETKVLALQNKVKAGFLPVYLDYI